MTEQNEEKPKNLTRREFLRDAGLAVGGVTLSSAALLNACSTNTTTTQTTTVTNNQTVTKAITITNPVTVTQTPPTVTITQTPPPVTVTATVSPTDQKITVLNPLGFPPPVVQKAMATRPSSLSGKPIYLVDVNFDNGDLFLDQMKAWFSQNMPEVNTIRRTKAGYYASDDPALWQEIKSSGGIMVMAIGH